jgi:hypothetical protein
MPGPNPRGDHALTPAERSDAYLECGKAADEAAGCSPLL